MISQLIDVKSLHRARRALAGLDDDGRKVYPGMFDSGVVSFAHGEGVRRPYFAAIQAGVRALLDTKESSLDNYLFLKPFPAFENRITAEFISQGVGEPNAKNIAIDCGTTRLFLAWLNTVSRPGDTFVVAPTFYHPLAAWCDQFRIKLVCIPTSRNNDYKLTRHDLETFVAGKRATESSFQTRGIFLFNPTHTGAIYSPSELEDIAEWAVGNSVFILADLIFAHTEYEDPVPLVAGLEKAAEYVVALDGGSKAYGLANIRIGWACGPQSIIEAMKAFGVTTSATVPHIAKAMALAALDAPREYLDANRQECHARALLLSSLVEEMNDAINLQIGRHDDGPWIEIEHMPRAGHSMLLSLNRFCQDSIDITRYLLKTAKVAVSPGLSSGFTDCKVRLCFGCVGAHETYMATGRAEALAALAGILPFLDGESSALVKALGSQLDEAGAEQSIPGAFASGRAIIREAMRERVLPALISLLRRKVN